MKTAKEQISQLATRLRNTADDFRNKADAHDRYACYIDVISTVEEAQAAVALKSLLDNLPGWFPS